jgi:hypothetical protein
MCEWSHGQPRSDSWVSLISGELRETPEEDESGALAHCTLEPDMNGLPARGDHDPVEPLHTQRSAEGR